MRTRLARLGVMRARLARDTFIVVALAFIGLRLAGVEPWVQSVDAYAYWTTRSGDYYASSGVGIIGSYLYSPAFAQLLAPITWLPWQAFVALWTAINVAAYWFLVRRWALPLLLFLPVPFEIISGNVHLLIAVAILLGFRYPAAWSLILLTKVTPGVGLVWFAVRREWRPLAVAVGVAAAISVVSFVLAPAQWAAWVRSLVDNAGGPGTTVGWYAPIPLIVRLPIAVAVAGWGGVTDRRWTVPLAVTLALPVIWLNSLAILVAIVPLVLKQRSLPVATVLATGASATSTNP